MMRDWCRGLTEATLLVIVGLAPWAFGCRDAWAREWLTYAIALAALLAAFARWDEDRWAVVRTWTGLCLLGLGLLACWQITDVGESGLRLLAPRTAQLRADVLPAVGETVREDPAPPVALPKATLSLDPDATRDQVFRIAACWIVFSLGYLVAARPGATGRLAWVLMANGALLSVVTFLQVLTWNGKLLWVRPTEHSGNGGPFVNHNHLAAYLNMGLGFALAGLVVLRKTGSRGVGRGGALWLAYTAGLLFAGVLGSLSRSGLLGTLIATIACLALGRPFLSRSKGGPGILIALGLLVGGMALLLWFSGTQQITDRLDTLTTRDPYESRWVSWSGAVRAWWDRPVWGLGLGSYATSAFPYYLKDAGVYYHNPENEYLHFLAQGGLPGFALFVGLFASIIVAGVRAVRRAEAQDRLPLALGGTFGLIALAGQCLGDFPTQTPAIALTGTLLAAGLVRFGAGPRTGPTSPRGPSWRSNVVGVTTAALALVVAHHGWTVARSASELEGTIIPQPREKMPTAFLWEASIEELDQARDALDRALAWRPNWGEGHLWKGLVHLSRYHMTTQNLLKAEGASETDILVFSHPLWLHRVVHTTAPEDLKKYGDLARHGPVRDDLVPATRSFLEARRCTPGQALAQVELASLDYLLIGGATSAEYVSRGLSLAGPDSAALAQLGETAFQAGDFEAGARCLNRLLATSEANWDRVADACRDVPPEVLLEKVLPNGRTAIHFATRLYGSPEARPARELFLRTALERLPHDRGLTDAQRLHFEGEARAGLNDREGAFRALEGALALEPANGEWREGLMDWLIAWGRYEDAHAQALIGTQLSKDHERAVKALGRAVEALTRSRLERPDVDDLGP